jgi:hypothetical protein
MDWDSGRRPPPPIPWSILKKTRLRRSQDIPHSRELTVKRRIEKEKYLFLPNILLSQPLNGIMIAFETR